MKRLHLSHLFGWSVFNQDRNIDFHSTVWVRPEGNVIIDPLPLSDHDEAHLRELGGAAWIVITNSDHVRDSIRLAENTGAQLIGPSLEANHFPVECTRWLTDGDEVVPGLSALELEGSKTPGELALLLEGSTLITGAAPLAGTHDQCGTGGNFAQGNCPGHHDGQIHKRLDWKLSDAVVEKRGCQREAQRPVNVRSKRGEEIHDILLLLPFTA